MRGNSKQHAPDPVAVLCGKRLKACRKANGWTVAQLSEATGYSSIKPRGTGLGTGQISSYEQGIRRIGLEEAEILSLIFPKFPAAYFLGAVDEREGAVLQAMRARTRPRASRATH
jgi:transcriptional regulator with XRE-family HTH domain